jgi:LysR family cys regulon transcriptional activator
LTLLDTSDLFPKSTSRIALRRGRFLRGFAYRFIELCAPDLTEKIVKAGTAAPGDANG